MKGNPETEGAKDETVSNELTFYPYFPGDFDSSTRHLTAEQVGVYQRLLNWSWLNGPLPNQPLALQNIAGPTHQAWTDLWPAIACKFSENGNGLVNKRLEEERVKVRDRREKAKMAAEKRWAGERTTDANADADAHASAGADAYAQTMPSKLKPRSKSRKKKSEPPPLPSALDAPEFVAKWAEWEAYRREIRKKLTKTSRSRQLAALAKVPIEQAMAALDLSMQNGWTGVFPNRTKTARDSRRQEGTDETRRRQLEQLS